MPGSVQVNLTTDSRYVEVVRWRDAGQAPAVKFYGADQVDELISHLGDFAHQYADLIATFAASNPSPPAAELRAQLLAALTAEYKRRVRVISAAYPQSERESWHVQISEARALLVDPGAATPWIDNAAAERGIDRLELAERIVAKDDAYRVIHGALTGTRQRIEDQIFEADTVEKLLSIDVTSGWDLPSVDGPHPEPEEPIKSTEEEQE